MIDFLNLYSDLLVYFLGIASDTGNFIVALPVTFIIISMLFLMVRKVVRS